METFAFRTESDCLLDVKDLIAASVHDADGHFVGRIEKIVIDARSGVSGTRCWLSGASSASAAPGWPSC